MPGLAHQCMRSGPKCASLTVPSIALATSPTGLLISVLVRSSGPAIGLILVYQLFDNIVARTLIGFHLDGIAAWLPFQVHTSLLQFKQYWPRPSPTLDYHRATGSLLLAGIM